mmetsp:Transcript_16965/g.1517  ORF Transcript_16965/g.1517 Transcript_16965/m.1517 type:complete len:109 (+) Transcript_16965:104-430(+)
MHPKLKVYLVLTILFFFIHHFINYYNVKVFIMTMPNLKENNMYGINLNVFLVYLLILHLHFNILEYTFVIFFSYLLIHFYFQFYHLCLELVNYVEHPTKMSNNYQLIY